MFFFVQRRVLFALRFCYSGIHLVYAYVLVGGGDFCCGGGDGGFITFTGRGSRFFKLLNYVFLLLFGLFDLYLRRQTHTDKLWVGVFFVCFHVQARALSTCVL